MILTLKCPMCFQEIATGPVEPDTYEYMVKIAERHAASHTIQDPPREPVFSEEQLLRIAAGGEP